MRDIKKSSILLFFLLAISTQPIFAKKSIQPRPPIMGWASWNNFRIHINEDVIKSQADAMVRSGLKKCGYDYLNIDDGFFGGRDGQGNMLAHAQRFPKGMRYMAHYIHSKGLKAGIYSDAGINTCGSRYDKDTIGAGMGLYGHDRQDLKLFLNDWDFDFIKVDWCGGNELKLDEQIRYTEIGHIARQIKPNVVYNVCRWEFPGKWVTAIADSWRISGDINNKFESILHIIDLNEPLWKYASPGRYNDMDMLQVGRGMTYEEDKTHFTFWCLMHSPLLLGNDLTTISQQTLGIVTNRDLIAINQSPFVYQARRVLDYGDTEIWGKPLVSTISGEIVVTLLNRSKEPCVVAFNLNTVGLNAQKGYTVRDLWSKESFPTSTEPVLSRTVPAHGVVVLRLKGSSLPFNFFQHG